MTPLEFNKTSAQSQLEIFEAYFDSLNQQLRVPQANADYSDRIVSLDEKLSIFKEFGNATSVSSSNVFDLPQQFSGQSNIATVTNVPATVNPGLTYTILNATSDQIANSVVQIFGNGALISSAEYTIAGTIITFSSQPVAGQTLIVNIYPKQFYKLGQVLHNAGGATIPRELQEVGRDELYHLLSSDLTAPNANNPIYLYEKNQLTVYSGTPAITTGIEVAYLRKPLPPIWNFTVGGNNQYIYNSSGSFNFELHPAEQTELVLKILLYAGVVVKDPQIIQVAAQQVAQENQNQKS